MVLYLFFNEAGADTEVVVFVASISVLLSFFVLSCLLSNGEGWRPDEGKLIRLVTDGDVRVELEWFRPPSVTFSLGPPEVRLSKQYV